MSINAITYTPNSVSAVTSMLEGANSFWPVHITAPPIPLNGCLYRIVKNTSDYLFKHHNKSITHHYIKDLIKFSKTKNIKQLAHIYINPTLVEKANLNVVAKRIAVTYLFRAFIALSWVNTFSATLKVNTRMRHCPPIGFKGTFLPCKHILCPNCHLRKASAYLKQLTDFPIDTSAIVIKCETPFMENLHGYFPAQTNINRTKYFKKYLKLETPKSMAIASGLNMQGRIPVICESFHAIPAADDFDRKLIAAKEFANRIMEKEAYLNTTATVATVSKIPYLAAEMYNTSPIKILGSTECDFNDLRLHYTVNEFVQSQFNKKTNRFLSV